MQNITLFLPHYPSRSHVDARHDWQGLQSPTRYSDPHKAYSISTHTLDKKEATIKRGTETLPTSRPRTLIAQFGQGAGG